MNMSRHIQNGPVRGIRPRPADVGRRGRIPHYILKQSTYAPAYAPDYNR